ncbi:MAG: hypothetical protein EAZ08_10025 [Cytophagales bacterium]|nr:MAG: hypothetical protein EAZ08_10025 [Cytophagales bacterium]
MKTKVSKLFFVVFFVFAVLFYPSKTYAGSFWGWETVNESAWIGGDGCLYHVSSQVYNVFGINAGSRDVITQVACP